MDVHPVVSSSLWVRMVEDRLEEALESIRAGCREGTLVSWRVSPGREGRYAELPGKLDPSLSRAVREEGVDRLYSHQRSAWDAVERGENIVVVSPTASGKTLCYNLPVLNAILGDDRTRALYLFPTKALSQDQVAELHGLSSRLSREVRAYTYDGDTPADQRKRIRERANIVVTNPDMLHVGILPHHVKWVRFFQGPRWVVLDEVHSYRGVFGSHVTNVIRRPQRVGAGTTHRPFNRVGGGVRIGQADEQLRLLKVGQDRQREATQRDQPEDYQAHDDHERGDVATNREFWKRHAGPPPLAPAVSRGPSAKTRDGIAA